MYNFIFTVIKFSILLLVILSTAHTQNDIRNFTYTEDYTTNSNLTGTQPFVLGIYHYQDNRDIVVVRISRVNYYNYFTVNYCFEQRLLIRVIQANGSVTEINFDNAKEIQHINYCYVYGTSPIYIYPIFDQYILVTYIYATNTSDNTTFTDRGMILDWNGNIISKIDFGPSYLIPGTNIWSPKGKFIVNNITPKKGFLRLSGVSGTNNHFEWKQYGYKGNGIFYLLQNDTLELPFNYQITTFGTLNGGYAIVYANTTNSTSSNNTLAAQFTADAGLYAIMLNYNQTKTNKTTILHEMSTPNVKIRFSAMICSIDNVFVGHTCVAAGIAVQNGSTTTSTLTNTTTKPFYIKVHFHSTGSVFKLESIFDIPSSGGIETIRAMTFGGFALISRSYNYNGRVIDLNFSLYDDNNNRVSPRRPITSNFVSAFEIIQNNTLLIALNETSTTWNLFSMDLPRLSPYDDIGYGNIQVNSTNPSRGSNNLALNSNKISITFQNPVLFADGILYIYQKTNKRDVLRQSIRSKACDDRKCNILDNVVTLYVLNCTFNQPGGQYYIQIDNNFVMSADYRESIPGIDSNLWNFQTDNSTTQSQMRDGKYDLLLICLYTGLSDSEKHEFFTNLRSELVFIIPTEEGRLSSNERNQIDTSSTESKILISLSINGANSGEITATLVKNYLNLLIINKESTNVSTGSITMYLDETYGFQETMTISDFLGFHKTKLISFVAAMVVLLLAFLIAKLKSPKSENFIIFYLAITIFRIITVTAFVFTDAKAIQVLYIPSIVFLFVPIGFNVVLALSILFTERDKKFIDWFARYGKVAVSFVLLSGSVSETNLLGSCIDILLADIPQFVIQIFYILYSIEIEILLLFSSVASGLSLLSNILSKLFFIKFKAYSPYLST
ncbi:hypothetical protein F8M41_015476 [Gigaspora margarita]|uniref:Uncharacterized protein n=1 Tax=Gigaspora margarita TaxID=4874 RepID=A0A8H4AQF2_GIGMA|nr:hypothetical protein F8M41_015476 [Gigaspora margarita]